MGKLFPEVRPHKVPEFKVKQSKYPHVPVLPMRALIYGPSGSGKTVLLQNLILDIYKGCFARWYIFFAKYKSGSHLGFGQGVYTKRDGGGHR